MHTTVSDTSTGHIIDHNPALPQRGRIYTLRVIIGSLDLLDSPSLGVMLGGNRDVVQHANLRVMLEGNQGVIEHAHLTREQLLSVPGMAETTWRYACTPDEWLPVFDYVGPIAQLRACVDIEPDTVYGGLWVTPKGFPRKQYDCGAL